MPVSQTIVHYDIRTNAMSCEERILTAQNESQLDKTVEAHVIGIYPEFSFQTFEGWGCAMTETSCYLLSRMDSTVRRETLERWFGPKGMNARFIRMHIDSCDYSLSEYQAVEDPVKDPLLETFSIDRDRKWMIPVVKEALELAGGNLSVLLSPWSPPWQWKTPPEISRNEAAVYGGAAGGVDLTKPGRCFGGRLRKEYYGSWAAYLVKYMQAYLGEGIPVAMLSIQNEASAATSWDSCLWSGEEERIFLKEYLYPAMLETGLTEKIGIFIWDHNKERALEHIEEFMSDPEAAQEVAGFAYHWYSGDHFEALGLLRSRFPGKILMHSESCGLHRPGKTTAFDIPKERLAQIPPEERGLIEGAAGAKTPNQCDYEDAAAYAHDIIGDLNNGMQRWMDWNLIVDREGGPRHVEGGFAAPLVFEEDGSCSETISYLYLRAIGRVIRPGAVVIGKSVYGRDVEAAACCNTDGSIALVLQSFADRDQMVNIRMSGMIVRSVLLPAGTLSTVEISRQ